MDYAEYLELDHLARDARTTLQNYIRNRSGLRERLTARPDAEKRERQEDEAWDRRVRLGLDRKNYCTDEG